MNYYNDVDPFVCEWLRNLVSAKQIPAGFVDSRPIQEVKPEDLIEFKQCHFFAGIGGWAVALRLSGVPDDYPVWTGSCPCQPFSVAGKRKGTEDERHIWPEFMRLIRAGRPQLVFGEQVEGAVKHGWLDGVFTDLETENYSTGAAVLGAHSVNAPHIRQRLYWVADSRQGICDAGRNGKIKQVSTEWCIEANITERRRLPGRLVHTPSEQVGISRQSWEQRDSHWSDFDITHCLDGKARRIESGTFPLAHGVSNRVGLLRGYGNAICPQTAAEFIKASLDVISER